MSRYDIRPLDSTADTTGFDCGEASLNDYLKRYAAQDVKRGVARAHWAKSTPESAMLGRRSGRQKSGWSGVPAGWVRVWYWAAAVMKPWQ